MSISRATYCTREDVLSALGLGASPRQYLKIDRAIESAARSIDGRCHRTFHPTTATRSFPWPDQSSSALAWRLWLDGSELVDVTTLTSGGTTIPAEGYYLEPQRYGPPYSSIEINLATSYGWSTGNSNQRAINVTSSSWGWTNATETVTTLAATINGSAGTLTVASGARVGVGDLLTIDTERMIVTGRAWADTGKTTSGTLAASTVATSLAVAAGSDWVEGETLLIDTEQVEIIGIVGNTLLIDRAINSTALAAHAGAATIYAPRTLTVTRAANGTTAAAHAGAAAVARAVVPGPVHALAVGEALVELQQVSAAYARTAGSGDNERVIGAGAGLGDLRDQVETSFRRKVRMRAV